MCIENRLYEIVKKLFWQFLLLLTTMLISTVDTWLPGPNLNKWVGKFVAQVHNNTNSA